MKWEKGTFEVLSRDGRVAVEGFTENDTGWRVNPTGLTPEYRITPPVSLMSLMGNWRTPQEAKAFVEAIPRDTRLLIRDAFVELKDLSAACQMAADLSMQGEP